ncbi:MAG: hypothetical protein ACXW3L_00820, partial [Limisphaerales bacterium]
MKFRSVLRALGVSAALLVNTAAQSSSPDDIYLEAYRLILEADGLTETGRRELARERYNDAQTNLKRLQTTHPTYSKNAVEFRLEYVEEKLKGLPPAKDQLPAAKAPAINPNDPKALQGRIAQLESQNSMLEAKLREALSARPAEVDPAQFARNQERLNQVEKEKELLRVSLEQAQAKQPQAAELAMLEQVRGELEATKKQLRDNVAVVATLSQENQRMQALAQNPQNENGRVKELEQQRDALQKRLNEGSRDSNDGKNRGQSSQYQTLTNQLANLRARLEVFEARKAPYTKEELALMDDTIPKLA